MKNTKLQKRLLGILLIGIGISFSYFTDNTLVGFFCGILGGVGLFLALFGRLLPGKKK